MAGYKFVGVADPTAPFLNGVPLRDLTPDEFGALDPEMQDAVEHSPDLYKAIPAAKTSAAAPAETPEKAAEPAKGEPNA